MLSAVPSPLRAAADTLRKAPSLAMKTLDGKTVRLADRKGRIVVVDFWASWCAPCKATFPALNTLAGELADGGVDVLAVSEDEKRKDLDGFLAGSDLRLQVLIDPRGDAAGAFGVTAIPSMYVIDQHGTIRFSHPNYAPEVIDVVRREIAGLTATGSR
jgi:cytochrome c biogenesis protein CcmG/thiol:disulfide interchange protein DsbE